MRRTTSIRPLRWLGHGRHRLARLALLVAFTAALLQGVAVAQRGWRRQRYFDPSQVDRGDVPNWENSQEFKNDVFTFVRVK
ncbi:MAG TPA: hypothetical protein VJ783_26940, partial [Pirellulales bacterium]|nr:hypothetical protein [Pirellulales bacterium]